MRGISRSEITTLDGTMAFCQGLKPIGSCFSVVTPEPHRVSQRPPLSFTFFYYHDSGVTEHRRTQPGVVESLDLTRRCMYHVHNIIIRAIGLPLSERSYVLNPTYCKTEGYCFFLGSEEVERRLPWNFYLRNSFLFRRFVSRLLRLHSERTAMLDRNSSLV